MLNNVFQRVPGVVINLAHPSVVAVGAHHPKLAVQVTALVLAFLLGFGVYLREIVVSRCVRE
jgi:hypothetical protein